MHILTSFTAYFALFHQGRFVFVSKNIFLVYIFTLKHDFYPTALKGCRGIIFTHGVRMGKRAGGGKKFVRGVSQKL